MKTYKRFGTWSLLVGGLTFFVWGSMNSQVVDQRAFMQNKFDIKFAKRLDEMNGEIVMGRMAASLDKSKWSKISTASIKKTAAKLKAEPVEKVVEKAETPVAEPAITDNLELTLSGGLYAKKPLKDKSSFYGSARIANGVIEEITVGLPDGAQIDIRTSNERLNGNVFTYEDAGTGEMRSGLLYKVKEGVYMVTLTNDSVYPGLRLEFKTDAVIEQNFQEIRESWAYDNGNQNQNDSDNIKQAQNDLENQDNYNQESESAESFDENQEANFQFNFSV